MIVGKIVKVRFKKYFEEQRLWILIGKVLQFSEHWIMMEGRGIIVSKGKISPVDIDEASRILLIPRENIAHIRVLPDDFDVSKLEVESTGVRYFLKVKGGPHSSIGEL